MWRLLLGPLSCIIASCTPRVILPPWQDSEHEEAVLAEGMDKPSLEPISILLSHDKLNPKMVQLGGRLFFDPRLSENRKISCASCHNVSNGGSDELKHSIGLGGVPGKVNTPSVLNSRFNIAQFWDGRAPSLEVQARGPFENSEEMSHSLDRVIALVKSNKYYAETFSDLFEDGVNEENLLAAIATYERSLVTVGSRFDRWLAGDRDALSQEEYDGYLLFKNLGCIACHQGRSMGGNLFQKFGVLKSYFQDKENIEEADFGRYNVTKEESDKHVFKVPSLRTVVLTAPYFHDGSANTLREAIQIMGEYQLGRNLSEDETSKIEAFLGSVLGDIPDTKALEEWVKKDRKEDELEAS